MEEKNVIMCNERRTISPIPKEIHLFWFGKGEKSEVIKKCIKSWEKFAPDYKIVEWTEDNFDVNFCERSRKAYIQKKWAFVADIARLKVIFERGGVYLDTDVELIAPLEDLLQETNSAETFFLFHNERFINTGVGFGAVKESQVIGYLLNNYLNMEFDFKHGIFNKVCTQIETEALEDYYSDLKRNNNTQIMKDNTIILSTSVWNKYSLHHGTGTWVDGGREDNMEIKHQNLTKFKKKIRNPEYFLWVRKYFGRKAEYIYEFLTYDLIDMGFVYFLKRFLMKIKKKF